VNRSLRTRLSIWLSAAILVVCAATAAIAFATNYDDANALQDTQLRQVAAALASQPVQAVPPHFKPKDSEDAETHFVIRLLGSGDVDPDPMVDVALPLAMPEGLQSVTANGVEWRVLVTRDVRGRAFGIAQRQTVRDEVARDSAMLTLLPILVLVPVLLLIINLLLRQGFAPLVALSRQVDRGDGHTLASLEPAGIPSEALPLVLAVNGLLTRLGSVLEQQRRMVADAAHELRTPVAAARIQADNLEHEDLAPEATHRLQALQQGLKRISELVDQLLRLARLQGAAPVASHPIQVDVVVRQAIEETLTLAVSHEVDLGCVRLDAALIRGDGAHFHALARNAIDNAVRYTPAGGQVDVSVEAVDGTLQLTVEDTGPGIAPEFRERVFEPFFRILGTQQIGNGLGLAIVQSAAASLGGTVRLESRLDGRSGLRFVYRQSIA
jgi:two-component system OmpR family sensor kinase